LVHTEKLSAEWRNEAKSLHLKEIKETEVTLDNIKEFTHFQLINALNDFDDMFIYPIEKIINLPKEESDLEF
jgi:4-amino-4-deoxychorismate lyase